MTSKIKPGELLGKDLKGFRILEMTEVYRVNEDGRKMSSVGFFNSPVIAKAFAATRRDAEWHQTQNALVLTNGTIGYVIGNQEPVHLFDDAAEAAQIKQKEIKKMSPEVRSLLGLEISAIDS